MENLSRNELVTEIWVYFCMNYPTPKEFINYICEKANEPIQQHLQSKFDMYYRLSTSDGVMSAFYCNLGSRELRSALVEYCIKIWAPKGMRLTDEQITLLNED